MAKRPGPAAGKAAPVKHQAYTELFKFSAEDLMANNAGALSKKQRADVTTLLIFQVVLGVPLYSFLTLVILGNLFQIPLASWIAGLFGWQDATPVLSFGGPWLIVGLLALLASSFWWLPRFQDYQDGRVQTVTGKPTEAKPSSWNWLRMLLYLPRPSRRLLRRLVHFTVEDVRLTLNEAQYNLITSAKRPHTFYYLPRSKQVIAVVPSY